MKVQSICAGLMVVAGFISVSASANHSGVSARATAEIVGCTDPTISGTARLSERRSANGIKTVDVRLFVEGLPEGQHAVHIHEVADCTPCDAAGGHFDPGPNGNSSPDGNHPFHLGDLINIVVNPAGRGFMDSRTTRFTLSPGPLSLFDPNGSVFMIHANPDTFCPDGPVPGCAGGARVACGIIEPDPPRVCGDLIVTRPEQCDDGNTTDGDGCSSTCAVQAPAPPPPLVPLSTAVQPIFNASCISCHNGTRRPDLRQGNARTALVNVGPIAGSACAGNGNYVVPGNPNDSLLVRKLGSPPCGSRMPLSGAPLTNAQIDTIRAWITQGAQDN